jgi:hypothetical protein
MAHFELDSSSMASSIVSSRALDDEEQGDGETDTEDLDLDDLETVVDAETPDKKKTKSGKVLEPAATTAAVVDGTSVNPELQSLVEHVVDSKMGKKRGASKRRATAKGAKVAKKGKRAGRPGKEDKKKLQRFRKLAVQMSNI